MVREIEFPAVSRAGVELVLQDREAAGYLARLHASLCRLSCLIFPDMALVPCPIVASSHRHEHATYRFTHAHEVIKLEDVIGECMRCS